MGKTFVIELSMALNKGIAIGKEHEQLRTFFEETRKIIIDEIKNNGSDGPTDFELNFKDAEINLSSGLLSLRLLSVPVVNAGGKLILTNVSEQLVEMIEITSQEKLFRIIPEENPGPPFRIEVISGR